MHARTAIPVLFAALALAVTACSSSSQPDKPAATATATATATTATPTVDPAAARKACVDAWVKELQDGTASADHEPAVCEQVPGQSAAMYAEALRERNAANRERMNDCLQDPTCTELPIP